MDSLSLFGQTLGNGDDNDDGPPKRVDTLLEIFHKASPEMEAVLRRQTTGAEARQDAAAELGTVDDVEWRRIRQEIRPRSSTLGGLLRGDRYEEAARQIVKGKPGIRAVVMGHTHETARIEVTRLKDVNREAYYVNTGCWQRTLSVKDARGKWAWNKLDIDNPAMFPNIFSYVVVDLLPDHSPAQPERHYWPRVSR